MSTGSDELEQGGSGASTGEYVVDGEIQFATIASRVVAAVVLFVAGAYASAIDSGVAALNAFIGWVGHYYRTVFSRPIELQETLTEAGWQAAADELSTFGVFAFLAALALAAWYWRVGSAFIDSLLGGDS